jgi:putative addiction module component (TIGR02574 family)
MAASRQNLLQAALALPEPERLRLVHELLETLNPDADGAFDQTWCDELDRRLSDLHNGTADTTAWADLREMQ